MGYQRKGAARWQFKLAVGSACFLSHNPLPISVSLIVAGRACFRLDVVTGHMADEGRQAVSMSSSVTFIARTRAIFLSDNLSVSKR